MPTCLHAGAILLSRCQPGAEAAVEADNSIPTGSVAGVPTALARHYGASGVMAGDEELVVGKLRFWPQILEERRGGLCVQQEAFKGPWITAAAELLPAKQETQVLRLECPQVAADYRGQGIAGRMLDAAIERARATGWQELRGSAIGRIPPLLEWSGQLSRAALGRRGFRLESQAVQPDLREGVVAQRAGAHGAGVLAQWAAFADPSDDDAGTTTEMVLSLGEGSCS